MNSTSCHTKKLEHQSCNNIPNIVSSTAPAASVEALEAKISPLEMLRVQKASECSSLSSLSISAAVANTSVVKGSDMGTQELRIPTKSENCKPGPKLNPASCASGLAMIVSDFGEGEGDDWISALSLTMQVERINDAQVQGNTHRRNRSYLNEDWGDLHYDPQAQGNNMFLGSDDI